MNQTNQTTSVNTPYEALHTQPRSTQIGGLLRSMSNNEPWAKRVLASIIVLVTLAGSCKGSRQVAKHEGSTALAGDAKLSLSLVSVSLSSMVSVMWLPIAAESTQGIMSDSSRGATRRSEHLTSLTHLMQEAGQPGGKHISEQWTNRGPEHLVAPRNKLGSEVCLLRRRGIVYLCPPENRSDNLPLDNMSAPWFTLPSTWTALSERWVQCAHKGGVAPSCKGCMTWRRLGDLGKLPPSCCLNGPGRGTLLRLVRRFLGPEKLPTFRGSWYAGIASRCDLEPDAGLPSNRAPQPVLEASVLTTFLLEVRRELLQRATALIQRWVTLRWKCPRCQAWDGKWAFSQYWRGRRWSMSRGNTRRRPT